MATFAIGDIHGNLAALADLLGQLRLEVAKRDVVVFLGDYIDRGPDSRGCIDAILAFRNEIPADVVCLRGNHEDWLLRTRSDYTHHSWLLGMEGLDTVRSYSADAERTLTEAIDRIGLQLYIGRHALPYDVFFDAVPAAHRVFLDQLTLCFENHQCFCAHAGLDPQVANLSEQTPDAFMWGNTSFPAAYQGDRLVVYGHWNNAVLDAGGWPAPAIVGNTIGIDTIAHGVLTAIRLPDRRVFQSARYVTPPLGV